MRIEPREEPAEGEAAPAEGDSAGHKRAKPSMEDYLAAPEPEDMRATFMADLNKMRKTGELKMARLQRDLSSADAGNKWHKSINAQLDICEDAANFLKDAERSVRGVYALVPDAIGAGLLKEGKEVPGGNLLVTELVNFKEVREAISSLNDALGVLARRSLDLGVVKMAPNAKVGYKTLEVMTGQGAIEPDVKKAMAEATVLCAKDDKDRQEKSKSTKAPGATGQQKRPLRQEPGGGWGNAHRGDNDRDHWSHREPDYRQDSAPNWGSGGSNVSMGGPRSGSQGMPAGKGGGKGGWGGGAGNACGESGHWARDCPKKSWGHGN